ncbi:hypothetical protein GCM10011351_28960 [Paraliobacillus quinghaiensis]|uniref:Uncharacterized protein n=1 Tax=Paraliobacillus quinghaiensis TaxID=470815 RepID=A0A917TX22_9BACI|nr:hypothetical protein [Paraliobacillus quinghaiensis]GGM40939.1 hypothetical protein GCM10011351_28960 [Paraliobacillus quinghaiensis]
MIDLDFFLYVTIHSYLFYFLKIECKQGYSEGITIGSTQEKVRSIYGEYINEEYSHDEYDNVISLGGKTGMSFRIIDDRVSEIFIWFSCE